MAFLFARNKPKSSQELTKATKELLQKIIQDDKSAPKVRIPRMDATAEADITDRPKRNWHGI